MCFLDLRLRLFSVHLFLPPCFVLEDDPDEPEPDELDDSLCCSGIIVPF